MMSSTVSKVHGGKSPNGPWLASQSALRPDLISQVEAVIRDPYGRRDVSPLCTWEDWHRGLQLLERALRRGSDTFTAADYRQASKLLEAEGHPFAGPLRTLGSYVSDVTPYRQSWAQRYASRAPTADEAEAAQLIADGHVRAPDGASWAGVDGARYALVLQRRPGSPGWRHAVVVENSADRNELVPFPNERSARGWIQNRVWGTKGPLPVGKTGPACRVSREEELLAWLIHAAHSGQPWDLLDQVVWTSHLRAELYRAVQTHAKGAPPTEPPGSLTGRTRSTFTHWLAFAPGWAADEIGWPDARHAGAYFTRLAMTQVGEAHALRVAEALACSDTEAAVRAGIATPQAAVPAATCGPASRPVPSRRRTAESQPPPGRPIVTRPGLQPPPRSQGRQAGPEPR